MKALNRRMHRWMLVSLPLSIVMAAGISARAYDTSWIAAGQPVSSSKLRADLDEIQTRLAALESLQVIPTATIVPFGAATIPMGWLPCDGSQLDGSNPRYAQLYATIGIAFGGNSTSQQFNLPDLRGRFLRGWDHGAKHDPDVLLRTSMAPGGNIADSVGSQQGQSVQQHAHMISDPGHSHTTLAFLDGNIAVGGPGTAWGTFSPAPATPDTGISKTGITATESTGSAETRPPNVAVNYIIKL